MQKLLKRSLSFTLYLTLIVYVLISTQIFLFKDVSLSEIFEADRMVSRTLNIIPLKSILSYFLNPNFPLGVVVMNVLGNIVIFIPMGIYLQLLKKNKSVRASSFWVFFISLAIETIQFIFGIGRSDIDDIILNFLGGLIGIFIYKLLVVLLKNEMKIKSVIVALSLIVGLFSFFIIYRYYPVVIHMDKSRNVVIKGQEFYYNAGHSDVLGQLIKFGNGSLTVTNVTGIRGKVDKFTDKEITVDVDPNIQMVKKTIDYDYRPNEILFNFEKFTYNDLKNVKPGTSMNLKVVTVNGKRKAKALCLVYFRQDNEWISIYSKKK